MSGVWLQPECSQTQQHLGVERRAALSQPHRAAPHRTQTRGTLLPVPQNYPMQVSGAADPLSRQHRRGTTLSVTPGPGACSNRVAGTLTPHPEYAKDFSRIAGAG